MKVDGYPYDEIVFQLVSLNATWGEVGRALMEAGLRPADMLRVVLPLMDGSGYWSLVQVALLEGPEDADYLEARGVMDFFLITKEEVLASLEVNGVMRTQVVRRLGLED